MTGDELRAALDACAFTCVECGSDQVRLDHAPALGFIPVIVHWPVAPGEWCPALAGGEAARLASLDLLRDLAAVVPDAAYAEALEAEEPWAWHRRERVAA